MNLSYILRLVEEEARAGRFVGHVQEVESGRTAAVRDIEEFFAFVRAAEERESSERGSG